MRAGGSRSLYNVQYLFEHQCNHNDHHHEQKLHEINHNSKEKVIELFYLKNDVHFNEDAHKKIFEKINILEFY